MASRFGNSSGFTTPADVVNIINATVKSGGSTTTNDARYVRKRARTELSEQDIDTPLLYTTDVNLATAGSKAMATKEYVDSKATDLSNYVKLDPFPTLTQTVKRALNVEGSLNVNYTPTDPIVKIRDFNIEMDRKVLMNSGFNSTTVDKNAFVVDPIGNVTSSLVENTTNLTSTTQTPLLARTSASLKSTGAGQKITVTRDNITFDDALNNSAAVVDMRGTTTTYGAFSNRTSLGAINFSTNDSNVTSNRPVTINANLDVRPTGVAPSALAVNSSNITTNLNVAVNGSVTASTPTTGLSISTLTRKDYVDTAVAGCVKYNGPANQTINGALETTATSALAPTNTVTTKGYVDAADTALDGKIATNTTDIAGCVKLTSASTQIIDSNLNMNTTTLNIYGNLLRHRNASTAYTISSEFASSGIVQTRYSNIPTLTFRRYNGNSSSLSHVLNENGIGSVSFNGQNENGLVSSSTITAVATQDWLGSTKGSRLDFNTVANSATGAPVTRMTINHDGVVNFHEQVGLSNKGTTVIDGLTNNASGQLLYDNTLNVAKLRNNTVWTPIITTDSPSPQAINSSVTLNGNFSALSSTTTFSSDSAIKYISYGAAPFVYLSRYNGTKASPSTISNTNSIGNISMGGYNGSVETLKSVLVASATEDWNVGNGYQISLSTCNNGDTTGSTPRVHIRNDGVLDATEQIKLSSKTTSQITGLTNSAAGQILYNTNTKKTQIHTGQWEDISPEPLGSSCLFNFQSTLTISDTVEYYVLVRDDISAFTLNKIAFHVAGVVGTTAMDVALFACDTGGFTNGGNVTMIGVPGTQRSSSFAGTGRRYFNMNATNIPAQSSNPVCYYVGFKVRNNTQFVFYSMTTTAGYNTITRTGLTAGASLTFNSTSGTTFTAGSSHSPIISIW
jgi:hypothetical protein